MPQAASLLSHLNLVQVREFARNVDKSQELAFRVTVVTLIIKSVRRPWNVAAKVRFNVPVDALTNVRAYSVLTPVADILALKHVSRILRYCWDA